MTTIEQHDSDTHGKCAAEIHRLQDAHRPRASDEDLSGHAIIMGSTQMSMSASCANEDEVKENRSYSDMAREIYFSDLIIESYKDLIHSIPECPAHGDECIPHAIEWVDESIAIRAAAKWIDCTVQMPPKPETPYKVYLVWVVQNLDNESGTKKLLQFDRDANKWVDPGHGPEGVTQTVTHWCDVLDLLSSPAPKP